MPSLPIRVERESEILKSGVVHYRAMKELACA
jgi:hypothetical protein